MFYCVYILQCNDLSYYTGCTENLTKRLAAHNKGLVKSTKDKLPVKIITYTAFTDKSKAFRFEKYLKSGSGRAFAQKRLR
ncbi:MAG: GIY-YIG nuclease family protein [Chlorobi bacterium]|nr:GIY-YIG nuclease family protein [Chlorobiota bacterium]